MTLVEYIKQKRKDMGYTQTNLADMLSLDYRMVQRWERDRVCPQASYLIKLIKILNLDLDILDCIFDNEKSR